MLSLPLLVTCFEQLNIPPTILSRYTNPSINLLQGPILYTYVNMLINQPYNQSYFATFMHSFAFLLFYVLFSTAVHPSPQFSMIEHVPNMHKSIDFIELSRRALRHFVLFNTLIFLVYSAMTLLSLLKHQKKLPDYFSQTIKSIFTGFIHFLAYLLAYYFSTLSMKVYQRNCRRLPR